MNYKQVASFLLAGMLVMGAAGCGNGTSQVASLTQGGQSSSQGQGQGQYPGQGQGQGQGYRRFQPNFTLKTNPSTPQAGQKFTIELTMQRPSGFGNRGQWSGRSGGGQGYQGGQGSGGSGGGNWGGGQGGQGRRFQSVVTAKITGNNVSQTVNLTRSNGVLEGSTTIGQAGTYQVNVSMQLGPQTIQKKFSVTVK